MIGEEVFTLSDVVIISSVMSPQSRLKGIENKITDFLINEAIDYDLIDIINLPPEDLFYGNYDSDMIVHQVKKIEQAKVIIILSPVYKASFTGLLKLFLDIIPEKGFANKVVLPILLGGTYGHLLVKDVVLKPVCHALGATNILHGVYALDSQVVRLVHGGFEIDEALGERLEGELVTVKTKIESNVYI